jgi:hypothetical protein
VVDAIVMAGVAGTPITADLGAPEIRDELDALVVMGVRSDHEPGHAAALGRQSSGDATIDG